MQPLLPTPLLVLLLRLYFQLSLPQYPFSLKLFCKIDELISTMLRGRWSHTAAQLAAVQGDARAVVRITVFALFVCGALFVLLCLMRPEAFPARAFSIRGTVTLGCAPHPPRALEMYNDLSYPLRTPDLAIDAILCVYDDDDNNDNALLLGIVLCKRQRPPHKMCFPGGYVEYAESVEHALEREVLEETGMKVNGTTDAKLFGVMSDPLRDKRRHTVSVAFEVRVRGSQRPVASDDVKSCDVFAVKDLRRLDPGEFAFDHHKTLQKFLESRGW